MSDPNIVRRTRRSKLPLILGGGSRFVTLDADLGTVLMVTAEQDGAGHTSVAFRFVPRRPSDRDADHLGPLIFRLSPHQLEELRSALLQMHADLGLRP